eukprot:2773050-Rhodomonas_salina.1
MLPDDLLRADAFEWAGVLSIMCFHVQRPIRMNPRMLSDRKATQYPGTRVPRFCIGALPQYIGYPLPGYPALKSFLGLGEPTPA